MTRPRMAAGVGVGMGGQDTVRARAEAQAGPDVVGYAALCQLGMTTDDAFGHGRFAQNVWL